MKQSEFLNKHENDFFSFHKITRLFEIEYINTELGLSVKGKIKDHSNLDLEEDGHSLYVELESIEVTYFEPLTQ